MLLMNGKMVDRHFTLNPVFIGGGARRTYVMRRMFRRT
jgi:hypothetical protein